MLNVELFLFNSKEQSKLPALDQATSKAIKFPIQSSIVEFKESDFERYSSLSQTRPFTHLNFINENNCAFYELQLQKSEGLQTYTEYSLISSTFVYIIERALFSISHSACSNRGSSRLPENNASGLDKHQLEVREKFHQ